MDNLVDPALLSKLVRYRCRRGVRELDVLLGGFYDQCFSSLSTQSQQAMLRLLEWEDMLLIDALFGIFEDTKDREVERLLEQLRHYANRL